MVEENRRITFLDSVRGIASLLVLLSHSLEWFFPNWSSERFEYLNFGTIGVVAFFLVSGFVIPYSYERYNSVKKFLLNRFFRIYPVYFLILIITLMFYLFDFISQNEQFHLNIYKILFLNVLIIQDYIKINGDECINLVGGAWTLTLEFFWYFIFIFINFFLKLLLGNKQLKVFAIVTLGVFCLSIVSFLFNIRIPMGHLLLIYCSFLGYFVYQLYYLKISTHSFYVYILISIFVISWSLYVSFIYFPNKMFSPLSIYLSYFLAFSLFFFFYKFNYLLKKIEHVMFFLAKISYSLYLCHTLVLHLVKKTEFSTNCFVNIFIAIFFSGFLAMFIHHFIEKEVMKFSKKLF